ncbi:histamine N-methyltransferase-like [Tachysurus vachellii]|uniref:histamine N-methyltransferase-like n=1 Tax=Tachysurus vachellii TaxID=175792 RepID=UPI00296A9597|nr:histamine N-methyltransferase-like [Tachysurus vachellii]
MSTEQQSEDSKKKIKTIKMQSLLDDYSEYLLNFELLLANSTEHQCLKDFIHTTLPDILASIGSGESILNVMGVGTGPGEIDLEILKLLHEMHPDAKVENEVVEPSDVMIKKHKALLSKTPGLDYVNFTFNEMTAVEFEKEWKTRNSEKKMHFISMIEMLYYVEDPEATLSFYRSLLHKDGKVLLILLAGECAWARLTEVFEDQMYKQGTVQNLTTSRLKCFLDSKKIPYKNYKLQSLLDITECFIPGDKKGDRLLDLLTEVIEFRKTASPEQKEKVMKFLKLNSQTVNGRILFDCSAEALLIDA